MHEMGVTVSLTPLDNFDPKVEVAVCFIEDASCGETLFLHRMPHCSQGNKWCVPGGKLEAGESPLQAVVREVEEETALRIEPAKMRPLCSVHIRYPSLDFDYHMFHVELACKPAITLNRAEHSNYEWLTLDKALTYPLILGEIECIYLAFPSRMRSS